MDVILGLPGLGFLPKISVLFFGDPMMRIMSSVWVCCRGGLARGRRNSDLRGRFRGEKVLHASSLDAESDVWGVGWGGSVLP